MQKLYEDFVNHINTLQPTVRAAAPLSTREVDRNYMDLAYRVAIGDRKFSDAEWESIMEALNFAALFPPEEVAYELSSEV